MSVLLIATLTFAASDAFAQPLTLRYQETATRKVEGATAAFSLDPSRVTASAQNGVVTLIAKGPGRTHIIVIIGNRSESLEVSVSEPPTAVLSGPALADSAAATSLYDMRFTSDPGTLQGTFRSSRRAGDRTTEFWFGGATPLEAGQRAPFSVPLAGYTVRTPSREITLLDAVVTNSPMTVSRATVRGLHLREGPWQLHAGYSFFANFEHLLLPTNKEAVVGIGYRYRLGRRSALTPNFYSFAGGSAASRTGSLGTILYEAAPSKDARFVAEVGVGRTAGGAVELEIERPNGRLRGKVRVAPSDLPSLTADQQSGRHIEGLWTRYGKKLSFNANVSSRAYGRANQTSRVAGIDLQYRPARGWSLHGGSGYSAFETSARRDLATQRLSLPVGAQFSKRNVGLGLDYQFSKETNRDLAGHLLRASVNGAAGGVRFSAFGERQTQAPTAGYILASVPWLQQMLDRLGLTASTPDQLAELLRVNAEIAAYGYANVVRINVTPIRSRVGASIGWSGSGTTRPQLLVNTLIDRDESFDRTSRGAVHTMSYSQRLGPRAELFSNWSLLCSDFSKPRACRPMFSVSLRQTFNRAPRLLLPERQGDISGTVFRDERASGVYSPGLPTVAGVDVVLDGVQRARTDAAGRFRFDGVPFGRHRVEVQLATTQSFFLTTPSPAEVDTGSTVDFGIATRLSGLRAEVRNDVGAPLAGVIAHIVGPERKVTAQTADDGTFVARGLPAGTYEVMLDAGSLPVGYALDRSASRQVIVEDAAMGKATFVLRPHRSITGQVRAFDSRAGTYVPVRGTVVELRGLQRKSVTESDGLYMFRDLPPGDHLVLTTQNGREHTLTIRVPDGPAWLKGMDLTVPFPAEGAPPGLPAEARRPRIAAAAVNGDSGGASFIIQIAALRNMHRARSLAAEIQRSGLPVYVAEPIMSDRNPLYRVRVGPFASRAEADEMAAWLAKARGEKLWVTKDDEALRR